MTFFAKTFDELSNTELYEILKSRYEIFTSEQGITEQDLDDVDKVSLHCFFVEGERVVGYLRAFKDDSGETHIGRVLSLKHRSGIGTRLMQISMPIIKERFAAEALVLNAQTHAIGFYEKFGFKTVSEEFLDAGIPHVKMEMMI